MPTPSRQKITVLAMSCVFGVASDKPKRSTGGTVIAPSTKPSWTWMSGTVTTPVNESKKSDMKMPKAIVASARCSPRRRRAGRATNPPMIAVPTMASRMPQVLVRWLKMLPMTPWW